MTSGEAKGDVSTDQARAIAAAVARRGAGIAFGVPGGGSNLDLVAACEKEGIRFVLSHGETAACLTAAVHGHLVGAPALALATRGPGAASAVNGVAAATLDRLPLLLVTDAVAGRDRDRDAHQRLDQTALLAPATKWSGTLGTHDPEAVVDAALDLAAGGPPGAVHLDTDPTVEGDPPPARPARPDAAGDAAVQAAATALGPATRPVVLVGVAALDDPGAVRTALERLGWPVLSTYQAAGILPTTSPLHAGLFTNATVERPLVAGADAVLAVGLDPVEPLPGPWPSTAPLVAVTPWPQGGGPDPTVELVGPLGAQLSALVDLLTRGGGTERAGGPAAEPPRAGGTATEPAGDGPSSSAEARAAGLRDAVAAALRPSGRGFGPLEVVEVARRQTPADALVTVDAGAHFLPVMPSWPALEPSTVLISNGLATMGFAVPAAVGAALARPGRPVLALTGDGGLGMALAELETIARLDLPVTVVVFNDATLSLIALKQRPGGASDAAVRYTRADFATVARGLGLHGATASSASDLERELRDGWERPRLVDARIDPADYGRIFAGLRG